MLYIATLQELKADLGIADPVDDALLTQKAENLQGRVDDHLSRILLRAESVEEVFDGDCSWLLPARYPIETVISVYQDSEGVFGQNTVLASTSYKVNKARGRIAYGNGLNKWAQGFQSLKVVYTGGYVAAGTEVLAGQNAMPEGIRRAFLMQFGFEWRNKGSLGNQSVSAQGASVSMAPAKFLPEVEDALAIFKRF